MRYNDLTDEQTAALLRAIRDLPTGWRDLDDVELLALLTDGDTGPVTNIDTDPAPGPERETDPVIIDPAPASEPTPQGAFSFSVPTSGWGAEAYRVHWGDESAEIAQSGGNRASLAEIETALESLSGVRDVEVTAPGLADIIEGTGGRPYRVEIVDAVPGVLRVEKGNGKHAGVRTVDDDTAPADPGETPAGGADPGGADTGAEQTPARQGAIVIEIPFSVQNPEINPLTTDYYGQHIRMAFYGPNADTHIIMSARFNYDELGTRLSVKDYEYQDYFNGGTQQLDAPTFRFFDNLKSGLEAALESLPNIATAEVITLSSNNWRIELTEGPGGLSHYTYNIYLGRFPYEHEGLMWGGGHYASATGGLIPLQQQGGAQFQFDAVTSGALPLMDESEMAGGDDAGADPVASVPAEPAWPWPVHLADPAGLDYIGA